MFLTSNNTRELSEALKRRCLFLHIDYPDLEREKEIVLAKVPEITDDLAEQVARIVRSIRQLELKKAPSISETIDWARTLLLPRHRARSTPRRPSDTLNILLKYQSDIAKAGKELEQDERDERQGRGRQVAPAMTDTVAPEAAAGAAMLELLAGFVHELRARRAAGEPHREPRRHGGGQAHPARGPRGVQVRARPPRW